jgi:hypothetical protein
MLFVVLLNQAVVLGVLAYSAFSAIKKPKQYLSEQERPYFFVLISKRHRGRAPLSHASVTGTPINSLTSP